MSYKRIFLLNITIFFIIGVSILTANEPEERIELKDVEALLLTTIEGRLSLQDFNGRFLILTTNEGKDYALLGELVEKNLKTIRDLENKRAVLAGIPGNIHKKVVEIQQSYEPKAEKIESRTFGAWEYTEFSVLYIDKIEDVSKEVSFGEKEVKYPKYVLSLPEKSILPSLHQITGKVKSVSFRKPIPTIEIQEFTKKEEKTLLVYKDTVVVRVENNQVFYLLPTAIKKGDKVDLWYSREKDKDLAQIISILDN